MRGLLCIYLIYNRLAGSGRDSSAEDEVNQESQIQNIGWRTITIYISFFRASRFSSAAKDEIDQVYQIKNSGVNAIPVGISALTHPAGGRTGTRNVVGQPFQRYAHGRSELLQKT